MKVIVTTQMHPDFEKRTLGSIIKDGISYVNISAYSSKEINPKGIETVCLEDLPVSKMVEIYNPLDGYTGTVYFGAAWAYEAELPKSFSLNQKYLEKMESTFIDDRKRIGLRIKQLREEQGLTQLQLAERTGLKQQNIGRIESGKYSTGQDILSTIAAALGKRLDLI